MTATGPIEPPPAPNDRPDLLLRRGPVRLAERRDELLLAQAVVAPDERQDKPLADHDRHRFRRRRRIDVEEVGQRLDRRRAGRLDLLRLVQRFRKRRGARDAAGGVVVGEVVAVLAADENVLAGFRGRHEAGRLFATHDSGLGDDVVRLEPAALPDALVCSLVRVEAPVEPRLVAVERVRVLHDELAHAQKPAARPRLVALLRAEVVPELRQLLVRLQLACVERHRLLVREPEDEVAPRAVFQLEHLRNDDAP